MRYSGFNISMRYAPELQTFEVWVSYIHPDGNRTVLDLSVINNTPNRNGLVLGFEDYPPHTAASVSFLIDPGETYELTQELPRYGPCKPEKVEPDAEQIGWLRGQLEKVVDRIIHP